MRNDEIASNAYLLPPICGKVAQIAYFFHFFRSIRQPSTKLTTQLW